MPVQLSPLQLEGYYVKELSFGVKPELDEQVQLQMQLGIGMQYDGLFNPDPLTVNVQSAVAGHKEDPFRWKCVVRVESQNPPDRKYPYDFLATLVGYFKVDEQVPRENVESLIKVNGASVLYSAAREMLASTTGRGPFPEVLLPTVIFLPVDEPEQKQLPAPEVETEAKVKRTAKKGARKKSTSKKKRG
jgi:preprotein translocase subunit SecB